MNWLRQTSIGAWYVASTMLALGVIYMIAWVWWASGDRTIIRTEAVERGYAEWVVDKDGNAVWKWREPPRLAEPDHEMLRSIAGHLEMIADDMEAGK